RPLSHHFHAPPDVHSFPTRRSSDLLLPVTRDASGFAVTAMRARAGDVLETEVGAVGARGETLAATKLHFKRGDTAAHGHIALPRSEEHTSELQSRGHLVCRLLLEKK